MKLFSGGVCNCQLHQMRNRRSNPRQTSRPHVKEGGHAIVTLVAQNPNPRATSTSAIGCHSREEPVNGTVYTWGKDALAELTVALEDTPYAHRH